MLLGDRTCIMESCIRRRNWESGLLSFIHAFIIPLLDDPRHIIIQCQTASLSYSLQQGMVQVLQVYCLGKAKHFPELLGSAWWGIVCNTSFKSGTTFHCKLIVPAFPHTCSNQLLVEEALGITLCFFVCWAAHLGRSFYLLSLLWIQLHNVMQWRDTTASSEQSDRVASANMAIGLVWNRAY